jgi:hypothetical protein
MTIPKQIAKQVIMMLSKIIKIYPKMTLRSALDPIDNSEAEVKAEDFKKPIKKRRIPMNIQGTN